MDVHCVDVASCATMTAGWGGVGRDSRSPDRVGMMCSNRYVVVVERKLNEEPMQ